MVMFEDIRNNAEIRTYIEKGNENLGVLGFTKHSIGHATKVSDMAARILEELKKGGHYIPALKIFGEKEIQERHYHLLMKEAEKADFSQKIRILYAVSRSMKFTKKCFDGKTYDVLEQECFSQIQKEIQISHSLCL